MHQKKCSAALTALLLALTGSACGSKPADTAATEPLTDHPGVTVMEPADPATEETVPSEEPSAAPAALHEIPEQLMHTVLSGVNGENGAFAVRFDGQKADLYRDASGNVTEGFWSLEDGVLHIYSDETKTDEVYTSPFDYNDVKNVLRLDGKVYMADTGSDSLDEEAGRLSGAAEAFSAIRDAYWGGGDSSYALIFRLAEDGSCDMHYYDGIDGVIDEATFFWAMSGSSIFFYNADFAPVMHFDWSFDGTVFSLSDPDTGTVIGCTPLSDEESSEVSRQLGVLAGAYESEGENSADIDSGNYEDFDVSVDP